MSRDYRDDLDGASYEHGWCPRAGFPCDGAHGDCCGQMTRVRAVSLDHALDVLDSATGADEVDPLAVIASASTVRLVPAWMATFVIDGHRSSAEYVHVRDDAGVLQRMHRMTPVLRPFLQAETNEEAQRDG